MALLPKAAPAAPWLPEPEQVVEQAQALLDRALALPLWVVWCALGVSLLLLLLHRHAQRPLTGLLLAAAASALSLLWLPALLPDSMVPGLTAVLASGAALGFGIGWPGPATAVTTALLLGGLGGFLAVAIPHVHWAFGAGPFALLGFFVGLTNHLAWGLWMPPLWSALGFTLGAVRLLAAPDLGAKVPLLAEAAYAGGLFLVLAVLLLAVSLEREHRRKRRAEEKALDRNDVALKAKLERDRKLFAKHLGDGAGPGTH